MKRIYFTVLAVLMVMTAYSQSNAEYFERGYVYLKNGSVIKGRYIYSSDLEKLRVISGKTNWIFDASEVQMISRRRPSKPIVHEDKDLVVAYATPSKFFNFTEVGILAGNPENSQSEPLVIGTSFNYSFLKNLSAGAGVGVEFLQESYLPVTANLMYKIRDAHITPYVMLQAGYQVPIDDSRTYYYDVVPNNLNSSMWPRYWPESSIPLKSEGGLLVNPSIGFISYSRSGLGFSMSLGYRFHRLRYTGEQDYILDVDYNRLSIKLGLIIN